MNRNAAYREPVNSRLFLASIAALLSLAVLLVGFGATASGAPMGKDGKLYACYKVKGKPKGAMRVVPGAKARCKRGERKVVWSVAGSISQAGANGQAGGGGQQGESGSTATSSSNEAALKTEVAGLKLQVEGLEGLLQGVDKGDLSGLLEAGLPARVNSLEGVLGEVTNAELEDAIESLPLLNDVCAQSSALTSALNPVLNFLSVLGLDPVDPIVCPAP